jgi:hypothetical protein
VAHRYGPFKPAPLEFIMNKLFKSFPRKSAALAALAGATAASHAALPESVSTAVTTAGTDTTAAIALMIGVVVGIWGLRKVMGLFGR